MEDPRDWQRCAILDFGQYIGTYPSWLPSGEILYKGYTSERMNTVRVFNPAGTANDRQVLQGAIGLDSGL
jgi:hypothetical protein